MSQCQFLEHASASPRAITTGQNKDWHYTSSRTHGAPLGQVQHAVSPPLYNVLMERTSPATTGPLVTPWRPLMSTFARRHHRSSLHITFLFSNMCSFPSCTWICGSTFASVCARPHRNSPLCTCPQSSTRHCWVPGCRSIFTRFHASVHSSLTRTLAFSLLTSCTVAV